MEQHSLKLDHRAVETMKWSAISNGVAAIIGVIFQDLSIYFIGGVFGKMMRTFGAMMNVFSFGQFLSAAIWGAIIGAGLGFALSKFYPRIQHFNKRYLNGKLDTFFKLLFYPWLVSSLLSFIMTSALGLGLLPLLIILAGAVVSSYVYAKMMDKYVGHFYHHQN